MSPPTYQAIVVEALSKTHAEGISRLKLTTLQRSSDPLDSGQVRIGVRAASVNFFDLLILVGKYQYKPQLPFVPLTEGAGVILETASDVTQFSVGQRVFFDSGVSGAGSEEIVLHTKNVHHLPEALSFAEGAGFLMGYRTAYHAFVDRGRLKPNEIVMVTGAGGGMGLAAIQVAKRLGAKVIAAASDDAKLAVCKTVGADWTVNYSKEKLKDAVEKLTDGHLCDVIYDNVGGDIFDQCVRCMTPAGFGRLLVVGFAGGRIPSLPANMALIKGFDLVGVRSGAQFMQNPELREACDAQLLKWANEGLKPYVCEAVPAANAKKAFALVDERKVVGKTVVTFGPPASRL